MKLKNPLTEIPGIGASIAKDLNDIGIQNIQDLVGKNPSQLYDASNAHTHTIQDRCLLYVFRCAVYYAEGGRDTDKLKWWNWKESE